MKTKTKLSSLINQNRIFLIMILLLPFLPGTAQDFTKIFEKKFDVDKGANLVIKNKFGDVKCLNWDESSISIVVTVDVEASSQEKANKVFDKIVVELTGSRTLVEGITTVGNINNADFSINYEIHMPGWINIDLNNQFGDIIIDETDGIARINLEYGAMEANAFNGPQTELDIKFSDAEAGFVKNGDLNIEYGEWKSKGAEKFHVYSRFTEVTMEKIAVLNIDSQYDEVNIGSAGEVIAISRFSDLAFEKINGDFDFDVEYGELDVDYIAAAFKQGKVRNTFADASLSFDPKASFNVDAEVEFGDLTYPKSGSVNQHTVGYTTNIYKGKLGVASASASQLTIHSKNANANINFSE